MRTTSGLLKLVGAVASPEERSLLGASQGDAPPTGGGRFGFLTGGQASKSFLQFESEDAGTAEPGDEPEAEQEAAWGVTLRLVSV